MESAELNVKELAAVLKTTATEISEVEEEKVLDLLDDLETLIRYARISMAQKAYYRLRAVM